MRRPTGPLTFKPAYSKFAAYFNVDNGGGKIRGIFAQDNAAVAPVFEAWLAPFKDVGATTVTMKRTGGTDHQSFDSVGLPGSSSSRTSSTTRRGPTTRTWTSSSGSRSRI